jgi:hypothetical protein
VSSPVTVQPDALRQLAASIESAVGNALTSASQSIESAEIEGSKFSGDGIAMGLAYPGMRDFVKNDLDSKLEFVRQAADELRKVADTYEAAENANILETPGG